MPESIEGDLRYAKGRLEALSDGIFAVAMTLMAFDIKVPDLPKDVGDDELIEHLRALGPSLAVYLMAFLLLGAYWLLHHVVYHHIKHVTRSQILLGLVFLLFVMLQPLATSLLTRFMHHRVALQIYYGNLLIIGALLLAQWRLAIRSDPTIRESAIARRLTLRIASFSFGAIAALIGAFWSPDVASVCLLGGILVPRIVDRIRRRASATQSN